MAIFKYAAKDASGRAVTGSIDAVDRRAVIEVLRKKDLVIISLTEKKKESGTSPFSFIKKKTSIDEIAVFTRQLATMVDAGIPMVGSLDILSDYAKHRELGKAIAKIRNDVESGLSLSEAISKHKRIFSSLYVSMVKAGETSGMLDDILERLAEYLEKTSALQRKIKSALMYPAVVSLMAFGITLFLLIKVVPIFKNIFSGFGAKLPTPTLAMLAFSDFVKTYFIALFIVLAFFSFILSRFIKTDRGRFLYDSVLLKLPIFGQLFTKVAISRFARTLSTLIKSGVSILSSFEIVGKTSGNAVIERAVEKVRKEIREGEGIAEPLSKSKIFPTMVIRMVAVGEQAGELEKMLAKIAEFYDEQVNSTVSALTSLIEPLIIAFLGIVIGGIVICMFLPIFTLTTYISGGG